MSEDESDDTDVPDQPNDDPATVELSLYELDVSVRGTGDDELEDVEETATNLMDYLVDKHYTLEDGGPEDHQVI